MAAKGIKFGETSWQKSTSLKCTWYQGWAHLPPTCCRGEFGLSQGPLALRRRGYPTCEMARSAGHTLVDGRGHRWLGGWMCHQ